MRWLSKLTALALTLTLIVPPAPAQPGPRKLALLVGINEYADPGMNLRGAENDVELMFELLTRKYGFAPADIVVLKNEKATRRGILDAFERHLIAQAQPGDVVVFHYSGHGSRVKDTDGDEPDGFDETIVAHDSTDADGPTRDISDDTFNLLLRALKTERVTVTFDSCFSGTGVRGNGQIGRTIPPNPNRRAAADEVSVNRRLEKLVGVIPGKGEGKRQPFSRDFKGVFVSATQFNQRAADSDFGESFYGNFTYHLTRALWQAGSDTSYRTILSRIENPIAVTARHDEGQSPALEVSSPGLEAQPFFFLPPAAPAAAVVTAVRGEEAELWLGGLGGAASEGTTLVAVDGQGRPAARLQLTRTGENLFRGVAKRLEGTLSPGITLQEANYLQRTSPVLRVAVASADLATARTAIDTRWLSWVEMGRSADLVLERTASGYRLAYPAGEVLPLPTLAAAQDIAAAARAALPKLRGMLARKVLVESASHHLGESPIAVSREVFPSGTALARIRRENGAPLDPAGSVRARDIVVFRVRNRTEKQLFLNALTVDSAGNITLANERVLGASGESLFAGVAEPPEGAVEMMIVASTESQVGALQELKSNLRGGRSKLANPFAAARALLDTVGTRGDFKELGVLEAVAEVEVAATTVLPQTFRVVMGS